MIRRINIYDFIQFTRDNKNHWLNYCEILLDEIGRVILIRPSHMMTLEYLLAEKRNITREELIESSSLDEKTWWIEVLTKETKTVLVWYNLQKYYGHLNKFQKKSLELLEKEGLIKINLIKFNEII